jgi:hypothetical protein
MLTRPVGAVVLQEERARLECALSLLYWYKRVQMLTLRAA